MICVAILKKKKKEPRSSVSPSKPRNRYLIVTVRRRLYDPLPCERAEAGGDEEKRRLRRLQRLQRLRLQMETDGAVGEEMGSRRYGSLQGASPVG